MSELKSQNNSDTLESSFFFQSVVDNVPNMIFVKDAKELRFVFFNKAGEDLLGYKKEDMIGKNDYDFFPKKEADFFTAKDRLVLDEKKLVDIPEESLNTRLKGVRVLHTKKIPIFDEAGEPKYLLGISEDITDKKELEDQVHERTVELEKSVKELEAFSYTVSHDLRAPLRAIDGFSELLVQDYSEKIGVEGKHFIITIRESVKQMGDLIDDLLAFSRIGRQEVKSTDIDMTALVKSVFEEVMKLNPNRIVEFSCPDLPMAYADATLLHVVWSNLISNAVKFSKNKESARIIIGGATVDGNTTYFVKDNGVGFDMKYADKLFGVFQRLHSTQEFKGSGIGLSIASRIILKHGGKIWAESALDQGASFYFSLPRSVATTK